MTFACANLRRLDLSGSTKITNAMMSFMLREFENLETFKCLRNPYLNNQVLAALGEHCPRLERLEAGGLPNEFNGCLSFEGVESVLGSKNSVLRRIQFHYCSKIGDLAIQAIARKCC